MALSSLHSDFYPRALKAGIFKGSSVSVDPTITDLSYDETAVIRVITQKQRHLSKSEIDQIIELYSEGASTYELASQFGCHRSTISRALKNAGVEVSHKASSREALTQRVLEMYANYMKPADIGKELNINVTTVRKILHDNDVRIRNSSQYPKRY